MVQGVKRSVVVMVIGLSALVAACGSPPPAAVSARSTPRVDPLDIGAAAATSDTGTTADADALSIGTSAVDTMGGSIADGQMISPFDDANPIVGLLDPLLRKAIQDAATAAGADGVGVMLTSGWRSRGFQQRLFDEAVGTYGSVDVASKFVASPEVSNHVLGKAVDVGPTAADDWMIRNGPRFGLCQIYANEIWHFELAFDAQGNCPPLRPNAAG